VSQWFLVWYTITIKCNISRRNNTLVFLSFAYVSTEMKTDENTRALHSNDIRSIYKTMKTNSEAHAIDNVQDEAEQVHESFSLLFFTYALCFALF
jgi:hypothetical protein